ncbi:MAG TPA: hypothetical protein VFR14_05125 [Candidatus Limnocylindrales bacterium]|nr:hypothetical protein [Candidatus Limnocylindrales bacterium]
MIQRLFAPGTGPTEIVAAGLIIGAKFLLPALIVRYPFAAGWANFVLDSVDGDLLIPLGLQNETYQPVDKVADWATYVAIVVVAYRSGWPIRRLILALFVFRSVGQVGFLLTNEELLLAVFPNFLEPLFLVTASILAYERAVRRVPDWRDAGFAILRRHRWLIGALIVAYKIQDEYFTHVANVDRSEWLQRLLGR